MKPYMPELHEEITQALGEPTHVVTPAVLLAKGFADLPAAEKSLYVVVHRTLGVVYIGQSRSLRRRLTSFICCLLLGSGTAFGVHEGGLRAHEAGYALGDLTFTVYVGAAAYSAEYRLIVKVRPLLNVTAAQRERAEREAREQAERDQLVREVGAFFRSRTPAA